jgi:competence protein ComEC
MSSKKLPEFKRIFFSGIYLEKRIIDPVYGELYLNLSIKSGSIVYGSAKSFKWKTQKKLTDITIKGSYSTIINNIYKLRDKLDRKIHESIGGDIGQMCSTVVLGKRGDLPNYLYKRFRSCGAAHILAVSGLHTGIVFIIILVFLRVLQFKRKLSLLVTATLVSIYAVLTGLRLPVLRASLMLWFFILGEINERNIDPINTLSASGILILILMPNSIQSISFQLSFIAVFSILIALKVVEPNLKKIPNNWLKKLIIIPLIVTFSAQIGTLPLVAYYFGYIPLFGLIANLILIPLVGTLIAGIFLLWVVPFLNETVGSFVWAIGYIMNKFMLFFEELPFSVITVRENNYNVLYIYLVYLIIILSLLFFKKRDSDSNTIPF